MVLIYIKLGTATSWDDVRLDFHLSPERTAGVLDFTNINDHITDGLNAGEIVQISEAEFYGIVNVTEPPIVINPPNLITITQYQPPCPVPAFIMFGYYNGKWYKILWSTIAACLTSGASALRFRVGNPLNGLDLPAPDDNSFINLFFAGTVKEKLYVTVNGIEIPNKDLVDPADYTGDTAIDYYEIHADSTPNNFKRSAAFSDKEIIIIRKL